MFWSLIKGAIVLACEVAGVGVIPTAITVVDALTTVIAADDPQVQVKNAVKDWAINTVADRVAAGVIRAVV
jgi:hypothetical protein